MDNDELSNGLLPWDESVTGNEIAEATCKLVKKHLVTESHTPEAMTLWVILTYCFTAFRCLPKLAIISPEKRCGKSTALEIIQGLAHKELTASNVSSAVLYRSIEIWKPTLIIDEVDTFLNTNEELRGIINSGHTKGTAYVLRCTGQNHEPQQFSTFTPMCMAGIGAKSIPDTIQDRSLMVELRRKKLDDIVTRLPVDFKDECLDIRRKIKRWGDDNFDNLKNHHPENIPSIANDRMEDNWIPLLTIADCISDTWSHKAREAMLSLNQLRDDDDSVSIELLKDIRILWQSTDGDRMYSEKLVERLIDLKDRPWCEWRHGYPMTQNSLARLLKPFKIKSKDLRIGTLKPRKGYERKSFNDSFTRYLKADSNTQ